MAELLTTKEIARYLKLRPETVLRKVKGGEIPAIKIGGRFRFDERQIGEWLYHNSTSSKNHLDVRDRQASGHPLAEASPDSSGWVVTP